MEHYAISGNIVDVVNRKIFPGTIQVRSGRVAAVVPGPVTERRFILPGLVDAHVHVESSMLVPSEFARMAVIHGTVAVVSDPHEIANVLGLDGVRFMIDNGAGVPFKFFFGAPSCVPATGFETSGARLGLDELRELLDMDEVSYLSEMMNFPGVLQDDPEVMAKLALARERGMVIDGHAPGLVGADLRSYAAAGISTDHECFTLGEARVKVEAGMHVLIREGSAARNFEALIDLLAEYPDKVMFCSDDKHPDDLVVGHINLLVRRAIGLGFEPLTVLRACTVNPVHHYGLDVGLLREGDPADYIIVDDFENFRVRETRINGIEVAANGRTSIDSVAVTTVNRFSASRLSRSDISLPAQDGKIRVIGALEGELITRSLVKEPRLVNSQVVSDPERDILKLVAINRYRPSPPAIAFISGFGLKQGALASSVAHDCHNIIALGVSDEAIIQALDLLMDNRGGIVVVTDSAHQALPLPVAGLMAVDDGFQVAEAYKQINTLARQTGTGLKAPFMTLAFMALLVIPELKLSDQGLFDGTSFSFTPLFVA